MGCEERKIRKPHVFVIANEVETTPLPLWWWTTVASPLHDAASVSIPFKWEEEPGKPKPFTTTTTTSNPEKCLQLPPRLFMMDFVDTSPTTVLEGPYVTSTSTSSRSFKFQTFSFRKILSPLTDAQNNEGFGSWRWGNNSSAAKFEEKRARFCAKPRFWGSIYQGMKQVVKWKKTSRKHNKNLFN